MTGDEVKYINQIAFSGAMDLLEVQGQTDANDIIGHFGLVLFCLHGFGKMRIDTLSTNPMPVISWTSTKGG